MARDEVGALLSVQYAMSHCRLYHDCTHRHHARDAQSTTQELIRHLRGGGELWQNTSGTEIKNMRIRALNPMTVTPYLEEPVPGLADDALEAPVRRHLGKGVEKRSSWDAHMIKPKFALRHDGRSSGNGKGKETSGHSAVLCYPS